MDNSVNHDNINVKSKGQVNNLTSIQANLYKENLEKKIETLKMICDLLDPYNEISDQLKTELKNVGIAKFDNPFLITNQLLMMMEDSITELQELNKAE